MAAKRIQLKVGAQVGRPCPYLLAPSLVPACPICARAAVAINGAAPFHAFHAFRAFHP